MSIEYKKTKLVFSDIVSIEETEALLNWLIKKPAAKLDLAACTHLHAAVLQVLMASGASVVRWPMNEQLRACLHSAFEYEEPLHG